MQSPLPTSTDGCSSRWLSMQSVAHSSRPRRPVASAHSAATPATCGVAMLVPLIVRYRVGSGQDEQHLEAGPGDVDLAAAGRQAAGGEERHVQLLVERADGHDLRAVGRCTDEAHVARPAGRRCCRPRR